MDNAFGSIAFVNGFRGECEWAVGGGWKGMGDLPGFSPDEQRAKLRQKNLKGNALTCEVK